MDFKTLFTVFAAVFLAELGDKTQLAILSLSAESKAHVSVFVGAAAAMLISTLLAVVLGGFIATHVPAKAVHAAAGIAFIVIGLLILLGKF